MGFSGAAFIKLLNNLVPSPYPLVQALGDKHHCACWLLGIDGNTAPVNGVGRGCSAIMSHFNGYCLGGIAIPQ